VTSHLLLAGLRGSWDTTRDLNCLSFVNVSLVIMLFNIGQLDIWLWEHVSILNAIPSLITGRARCIGFIRPYRT
jgi:hypothetical protein